MKKAWKKLSKIERKLLSFTLAVVMTIATIQPGYMLYAYNDTNSDIIDAKFSEVVAENKQSTTVELQVSEKENQDIQSITLPDGNKIEKASFKYVEDKISVNYITNQNEELSYLVSYTNKKETDNPTDELSEETAKEENVDTTIYEEKLTYVVSDIVSLDDMTLHIVANDISFDIGEEVDFSKGIEITDETNQSLSNSLNISVTNYGGYIPNTVGDYIIEYNVTHPVSKKNYNFTRKISVTQKSRSTLVNTVAEDTTTSIKLSSGNATLKDPSDFRLGEPTHREFNVTINYSSVSSKPNRQLVFHVPMPFLMESSLTLGDINSAKSIDTEYDFVKNEVVLTITFEDNVNISTSFDVLIRNNNANTIYSNAALSEQNLKFLIEAKEESTVISQSDFNIHIDQLNDIDKPGSLDISPLTEYKLDYSSGRNNQSGNIVFGNTANQKIVINKAALTGLGDDFKLIIPTTFNGSPIDKSKPLSYQVFENDSNKVLSSSTITISESNGVAWLDLASIYDFKYAFTDRRIEIEGITYTWQAKDKAYLYDNPTTSFISDQEVVLRTHNLGKLQADPRSTKPANILLDKYQYGFNVEGSTTTYVVQGAKDVLNTFQYADANVHHQLVTWTYDFPYEIQPNKIIFNNPFPANATVKIITNLGNEYNILISSTGVATLNKDLPSNEYIKQAVINSPLTAGQLYQISYDTKTTDESNNLLPNGKEVQIKENIASFDGTFTESKAYNIRLFTKNSDMILKKLDFSNDKEVIGDSISVIGPDFYGKFDLKSYKKLEIIIEGEETLSLIRELYTGALNLDGFATMTYTTNKNKIPQIRGGGRYNSQFNFNLGVDEYLTSLKIEFLNTNEFTNMKVGDTKADESIYINGLDFYNFNKIPEILPFDGSQVQGSYPYTIKLIGDGKEITSETGQTCFYEKGKEPNFAISEGSVISGNTDANISDSLNLAHVIIPKSDPYFFNLRDVSFDWQNTDADLLAMVGKAEFTSWGNALSLKIIYSTNKKASREVEITRNSYNFSLSEDEYLTSLKVTAKQFSGDAIGYAHELITLIKRTDAPRVLPNGTFLGDTGKKYNMKVEITASNISGTKQLNGTTNLISGVQKYTFNKQKSSVYHTASSYLGNTFGVSYSVGVNVSDTIDRKTTNNQFKIVNPTIYLAIDKNYSVNPDTVMVGTGLTADVTFKDSSLQDGSSQLKIEYKNYEKKFKDVKSANLANLYIPLTVKSTALPQTTSPIKIGVANLSDSMKANQNQFADITSYGDAAYLDGKYGFNYVPLSQYYNLNITPTEHTILPVSTISVGSLAQKDDTVDRAVLGYDNDTYKQQLSVFTNADGVTKDWKVYIPVPKAGQTVKYVNEGNATETAPSDYSLELSKAIEFASLPAGAKIEYTTDINPSYSLNSPDGGNYVSNPARYEDVTMIRITIPELPENSRLFPTLTYKVVGDKTTVGNQTAFGGSYYNFKTKDNPNYFYPNGGYTSPISYSLKDYEIQGTIWEDIEEVSNANLDTTDLLKAGVDVIATDRNNNQFTTTTDSQGHYTLLVPTHGATKVEVKAPNNLTANPQQKYNFVTKGSGDHSSVVDSTSGQVTLTLNNKNIYNVNAGLLAERVVTVHPDKITVKVGETVNVPAIAFPTYSPISYQDAADTTLVTVSNDGQVAGITSGLTTATVSIPDGKGGEVSASYEIQVIPAKAPSVTTTDMYFFAGKTGSFDPKSGVTILDGEDNPIDINDTTKVIIDTSAVDLTQPGRYPIVYTVNDGYNEAIVTRYVYIYGDIQMSTPNNKTLKVNTGFDPINNVTASYQHVDEMGVVTKVDIPVTTTITDPTTPSTAQVMTIDLKAELAINGLTSSLEKTYTIHVNEEAKIEVDQSTVKVKVGTSLGDIKTMVNAIGSMQTPSGKQNLSVDWSNFASFDTSIPENTLTANITVTDPDTGSVIEKEITLTITKNISITINQIPEYVIGDTFNPFKNVTIKDGDGNEVTLVPDMIISNNVPVDGDGKVTTPGNYEIQYKYTDSYGNTGTASTVVKVHGPIMFNNNRVDQIKGDNVNILNNPTELNKLAWYIDSDGNKKSVIYVSGDKMTSDTVGRATQTIVYTHPINGVSMNEERHIYTHGKLEIVTPSNLTVKVNTMVNSLNGATSTYQYVHDNGTIEAITSTPVTSDKATEFTSSLVKLETVILSSSVEVKPGLINTAPNTTYTVAFNEIPKINVSDTAFMVKVGASLDEIKTKMNASATMKTVNGDITLTVDQSGLDGFDTSIPNNKINFDISTIDPDTGVKYTVPITVTISNEAKINAPQIVEYVEGDLFDPFKNVTIKDGIGAEVVLTPGMIESSNVPLDVNGKLTATGTYEIKYQYTDSLGNVATATTSVKVHGKIQFDNTHKESISGRDLSNINAEPVLKELAWYIDNEGNKQKVNYISSDTIDMNHVGKVVQAITYQHPINLQNSSFTRDIYIHGALVITPPANKVVKVNTPIDPIEGASATYQHVLVDGTVETRTVAVTSSNSSSTSSATPVVQEINLSSSIEITTGIINSATATYQVTFNGVPTITTTYDNIIVKVGATLDEIKNKVNAVASMERPAPELPLGLAIDWSQFDHFDTNITDATITANITVTDPDTNQIISKSITVTVSKSIVMDVPGSTDYVEGDVFDPFKDVVIKDGNGNPITLSPDLVTKNEVPLDSNGKATTPGNYEIKYTYTDEYGNTNTATTVIKVHGKIQFNNTRVDLIKGDSTDLINGAGVLLPLAHYVNSDGNEVDVLFVKGDTVTSNKVQKVVQEITYKHPINQEEQPFNRDIYIHGQVELTKPEDRVEKINTSINPTEGAVATYQYVNDDASISDIVVPITSNLGNTLTSATPRVVDVELSAAVEVKPGLINHNEKAYKVTFNGYPTIQVMRDNILVKVGATLKDIQKLIEANASVHYGKNTVETDLTNSINWDEVKALDTSIENKTYQVKVYVTDEDHSTVEKQITIRISKEIKMELPQVDKVIGDSFDPSEDVHITDGNGNEVNINDVIIDDSKVNMNKPGEYEVTYTYEDALGNKKTESNTIRVNGDLVLEGLDRVDLIQTNTTFIPDTGKAYYINYEGNKIYVDGNYNQTINQNIVGKTEVEFTAVHPVNHVSTSDKQAVYVHGDIVVNYPDEMFSGKVNTTINSNKNVSATYEHVNDDGTIIVKDVPVQGNKVTSDKVAIVDGTISMEVEVVPGLINKKETTAQVGFNGLGFIEGASSIYFAGQPNLEEVINAIGATAGMKKADGVVINLTDKINYDDLANIVLNKTGTSIVTITVTDTDGFTTYKNIEVVINIPNPILPTNPDNNGNDATTGDNGNDTTNGGNDNSNNNNGNTDTGITNNEDTQDNKDDVVTIITKDIPLSKTKNGLDDELVKSYIKASSKNNGNIDFEIISHNVLGQAGTFDVTVRLADGTEQTVSIKVIDDTQRDVQQPEYGQDTDCIIQWIMLLLLLGYSIYSISMILKRHNDNKKLKTAMNNYAKDNKEGANYNED